MWGRVVARRHSSISLMFPGPGCGDGENAGNQPSEPPRLVPMVDSMGSHCNVQREGQTDAAQEPGEGGVVEGRRGHLP